MNTRTQSQKESAGKMKNEMRIWSRASVSECACVCWCDCASVEFTWTNLLLNWMNNIPSAKIGTAMVVFVSVEALARSAVVVESKCDVLSVRKRFSVCEWVFHHSLLPDVTLDLCSIRRCRGIGVYEFAIVVQMRKKGGSTLLATMIVDVNDSPQQCKNLQKLLSILYRLYFHDGTSMFLADYYYASFCTI